MRPRGQREVTRLCVSGYDAQCQSSVKRSPFSHEAHLAVFVQAKCCSPLKCRPSHSSTLFSRPPATLLDRRCERQRHGQHLRRRPAAANACCDRTQSRRHSHVACWDLRARTGRRIARAIVRLRPATLVRRAAIHQPIGFHSSRGRSLTGARACGEEEVAGPAAPVAAGRRGKSGR